MEKINLEKEFKAYDGDWVKLPSTFRCLGFKQLAFKNKAGEAVLSPVLVVKREDGVEFMLFADQLRKEGDALFVSEAHLQAQIKRQEEYAARQGARPK